ncbi:hypothetical protein [Rhodanobacter sp. BL-MT-08]
MRLQALRRSVYWDSGFFVSEMLNPAVWRQAVFISGQSLFSKRCAQISGTARGQKCQKTAYRNRRHQCRFCASSFRKLAESECRKLVKAESADTNHKMSRFTQWITTLGMLNAGLFVK